MVFERSFFRNMTNVKILIFKHKNIIKFDIRFNFNKKFYNLFNFSNNNNNNNSDENEMSTMNKLPFINSTSPNPASSSTRKSPSPQIPGGKKQGEHQSVFQGIDSIPTPQPPTVVHRPSVIMVNNGTPLSSGANTPSSAITPRTSESELVPTSVVTHLAAATNSEEEDEVLRTIEVVSEEKPMDVVEDEEEIQPAQQTPPPQKEKKTRTRKNTSSNTTHSRKTTKQNTATAGVQSNKTLNQIVKEMAIGLKLADYVDKVDKKGTKWMRKDVTHKLSEIPTDPKHNEVEFVNWERFENEFVIYRLYTSRGNKYWSTRVATQWLETALLEGYTPVNSTFVVKNTVDEGLCYGFRYKDKDSSTSSTSSTPSNMEQD